MAAAVGQHHQLGGGVTAGAAISFTLSDATGHHGVIILNMLLVTLFMFIEARCYRYYELFASRVRLMETDFFAAMFEPPFSPAADWAESMAENLLHPYFGVSTWESLGRCFRRNYMWIYVVLAIAWVAKSAEGVKAQAAYVPGIAAVGSGRSWWP